VTGSIFYITDKELYKNTRKTAVIISIVIIFFQSCAFYNDEIEITQGLDFFPSGLDPATNTKFFEYQIFSQIYEPLVSLSDDYKTIIPCLADTWSISEDNLYYTFHLKPNVHFHDGSLLTAEDVKFSFQRLMKIQANSPLINIIEYIEIIDSLSIQIKLRHSYLPFPYLLASPNGPLVISKKALQKYGSSIDKNPIGTGPFVLEHWEDSNYVSLRSFPQYRESNNIDVVKFILPDDTQQPELLFKEGVLDILYMVSSHWLDRLKWLGIVEYVVQEPLSIIFLGFNLKNHPVKNHSIRDAVRFALETKKTIYVTNRGNAISANGPLPPIYEGFDDLKQNKNNPKLSRKLLVEEGYEKGLSLNLYVFEPIFSRQTIIEIIKSQLAKVGITINTTFYYKWEDFESAIKTEECHLFLEGYSSEYIGDPGNFLYVLFHSNSSNNHFNFRNKKVDQLLEDSFQQTSAQKRHDMYRSVVENVLEYTPAVFKSHIKSHFAYNSKKIKNLMVNPYDFIYYHRLETYE
jgi:peptide/nickel transport system substrate-binding protein